MKSLMGAFGHRRGRASRRPNLTSTKPPRTATPLLTVVALVTAATGLVPATVSAAQAVVLSLKEECHQARGFPNRNTADKIWLEQCVHALRPPGPASPSPRPTLTPTPTPSPSPTTPPPTTGTGFYRVV